MEKKHHGATSIGDLLKRLCSNAGGTFCVMYLQADMVAAVAMVVVAAPVVQV